MTTLLDLALKHETAILNHASLASPNTAAGQRLQLQRAVSLVRHPGKISMQLDGYPADVPIWYLSPTTARWTRHPRVQQWYTTWAEHARLAHKEAAK